MGSVTSRRSTGKIRMIMSIGMWMTRRGIHRRRIRRRKEAMGREWEGGEKLYRIWLKLL